MTLHFGSSLKYNLGKNSELNLALDIRQVLWQVPNTMVKQLHAGVEYKYRALTLRGGLNQMYPTFGASFEFPPHTKLHFSSYANELGSGMWEKSQRWWQLQVVIGFNPL
jgi:hypothetical protein